MVVRKVSEPELFGPSILKGDCVVGLVVGTVGYPVGVSVGESV